MTLCPANQILGPCGGLREPVEDTPMDARIWLRKQWLKASWALGAPGLVASLEASQSLTALKGLAIPRFGSVGALAAAFSTVPYVKDDLDGRLDYMKHPTATLQSGGDCEDHTALWLASLWRSGLADQAGMLNIQWEDEGKLVGHSVALWMEGWRRMRVASNWPRQPREVQSAQEAARWFDPDAMALYIPMVSLRQDGVVCFGKPVRVL